VEIDVTPGDGGNERQEETIDLEDSEHDDVVYMAMVQESISEETRELRSDRVHQHCRVRIGQM